MITDSQKIWILIGVVVVSTLIGFYDRVTTPLVSSSSVSVLPKPSVMVIPIEGMITGAGSDWQLSMVDMVFEQLKQAKDTKYIKAVVLRINSPGGTVGASQEIYNAILRFKQDTKKPVVVSILDIGASGAYWIALAGDYIYSQPGSIVGSLGVITQTMDLTAVPKKYGVNVRTYKSGPHKDLLNPWRAPTKDDTYLIQKMLTRIHTQFKDALIKRRKVLPEQAHVLADGRIYAGEDALKENLIDALGGLHDAIQYAANMANVETPHIMYPQRGVRDFLQSFRSMAHPFQLMQEFMHMQASPLVY
jgi:protease IV